MAGYELFWNGDAILAAVDAATLKGIDETMAGCVLISSLVAPRDTGAMANNIRIINRATTEGAIAHGFWGNDTQDYTIWQEIGSRGRAGRYFLRRAMDQEYPKLGPRIQAWLRT